MNDETYELLERIRKLDSNDLIYLQDKLLEENLLDFASLAVAQINQNRKVISKLNKQKHAALTLGEYFSPRTRKLADSELGREFLEIMVRSKEWNSTPFENDIKRALAPYSEEIENKEFKFKDIWGFEK